MALFEFLKETYGENEPIFVAELEYGNMTKNAIRQQVKNLTYEGLLKRYDTGIYFIPKKSIFRSGAQLSRNKVIEQKYLRDGGEICGYVSGLMFANQIGLTSQVPAVIEVTTNKAVKDYREINVASSKVIIRRPRTRITDDNYKQLQLLDLLKDIDFYSEKEKEDLRSRVFVYMSKNDIKFEDLEKLLKFYPDRIYKNMFEVGLIRDATA